MSGKVSVALARMLYDYLEARALDVEQTLGEPKVADDPQGFLSIPLSRWQRMLERADRVLGEPAFGLTLGATMQPKHLGLVGYLVRHCPTVADALKRHNEFERLFWDANPCRTRYGLTGVTLAWGTEMGLTGALADECNIAAMLAYTREATGIAELAPQEVRFVHPRPAQLTPYEDYFRCPVHFEAPTTIVRVSYGVLLRRQVKADPALCEILAVQARERLDRLPPHDPFLATLHEIIAGLLPEGKANLQECATRLNVSPRSLQRRLAGMDLGFQLVLDQVRMRLADSYLADRCIKLAEVALLLGYADQSAFAHACARWKGETPARWRARLPDTSAPR